MYLLAWSFSSQRCLHPFATGRSGSCLVLSIQQDHRSSTSGTMVSPLFGWWEIIKYFHYLLPLPPKFFPVKSIDFIDFFKRLYVLGLVFAFHISFSAFSGVGRTGTFIALDQLLKAVDDPSNQVIDVFNTCYLLRKERRYLVQTVTQYAYLYKCLSTYLLKKVHSE